MFSWLARAWNWATGNIDSTIASWVHDIVSGIWSFLHSLFSDVSANWDKLFSAAQNLWNALDEGFHAVAQALFRIVRIWIPAWIRWTQIHLVIPLLAAWHWLNTRGATLWFYLTHPPKLVDLIYDAILAKIESTAWKTARLLGRFFIVLIVRNLKTFAHLLEDVIDAIL